MKLIIDILDIVKRKANSEHITDMLLDSAWEIIMTYQSHHDDQVRVAHVYGNAIEPSKALKSWNNTQELATTAGDQELLDKD